MEIKKGQILELKIQDLAFGGKGIAKVDAFMIFIDGALPGQVVEAKISLKKRRHAEGKILRVLQRAADEVLLDFQETPGAPWMGLPIEIQQQHKKSQVFELFKRLAQTDLEPLFDEYIESPEIWFYRNKMEYSFGPTDEHPTTPSLIQEGPKGAWTHTGFGLGSKKRGQFWLVQNLQKPSGLFDQAFENIIPKIRTLCEASKLPAYNTRKNQGFWRQLTVRKSFSKAHFLVEIITTVDETQAQNIEALAELLKSELGERIQGFCWTQSNDLGNASHHYVSRNFLFGEAKITENINNLDFDISLDSFFQTNIFSAEKLYKKVEEYVSGGDEILELFSGTGTISQIMARQNPHTKITSVEIIKSAVEDAEANAAKNGIHNINFVCDDVTKFMKEYEGRPPTVILDPPRAGISPKALRSIIDFRPQEIIYVSCNPATLARDTEILREQYELKKFSLVDQFPHTSHVECVGKFVKKD